MAFHTPSTTNKNKIRETKEMALLTRGLLNQSVMATVRSAFLLYFILAPSRAVLSYQRALPLLLFRFTAVPRHLDRVGHDCVFMWEKSRCRTEELDVGCFPYFTAVTWAVPLSYSLYKIFQDFLSDPLDKEPSCPLLSPEAVPSDEESRVALLDFFFRF